jgi:hypothetical protein
MDTAFPLRLSPAIQQVMDVARCAHRLPVKGILIRSKVPEAGQRTAALLPGVRALPWRAFLV